MFRSSVPPIPPRRPRQTKSTQPPQTQRVRHVNQTEESKRSLEQMPEEETVDAESEIYIRELTECVIHIETKAFKNEEKKL